MEIELKHRRSHPRARENLWLAGAKVRRGRIYRSVRYCLIANDGKPVLIAQVLDHCYPHSKKHPHWHYTKARACLPRYAIAIDRLNNRPGRPYVWAPNAELRRLIRGS